MSKSNIIARGDGSQAAGRDINNNIMPHSSFIFDPQVLADLIDQIFVDSDETNPICDFNVIDIEEKNKKNGISAEFYEECIKEDLEYFYDIERFLRNPNNEIYKNKFFGIVKILKPKVITALDEGKPMQNILSGLFDYFFETKQKCKSGQEYMATTLAYYLYHCCYIGRK